MMPMILAPHLLPDDGVAYDAVDLCAGPGGWDVAALALGLDVIGVEFEASAADTRRAAGLKTIEGDMRAWRPRYLPARRLIGSPPCQPFSTAGKGAGRKRLDDVVRAAWQMWGRWSVDLDHLGDEKIGLVLEPLRWILEAIDDGRPYETINLEQVPSVLPVWECYAEILRREGYDVATGILTSEQYGVPQTRRRAILSASRVGPVALPTPTHSRYHLRTPDRLDEGVPKWVTMREALGWGATARPSMTVTGGGSETGGAEPFGNAARQGLRREQDAGRWVFAGAGETAIDTSGQRRRELDEPAHTITGKGTAAWVRDSSVEQLSNYNHSDTGERTRRAVDEPSVTITGRPPSWIGDKVQLATGTRPNATRRDEDQPAPTLAFGNDAASHVWTPAGMTPDQVVEWKAAHPSDPVNNQSGGDYDVDAQVDLPATALAGRDLVGFRGANANRFNGATKSRNDGIRITVEEAAALQTFPVGYPWQGNKGQRYQQVGNAIPCLLAWHVLRATIAVEEDEEDLEEYAS